jgi:hypothetical protein
MDWSTSGEIFDALNVPESHRDTIGGENLERDQYMTALSRLARQTDHVERRKLTIFGSAAWEYRLTEAGQRAAKAAI